MKYTIVCPLCPEGDRIQVVRQHNAKACARHQAERKLANWTKTGRAYRIQYSRAHYEANREARKTRARERYHETRDAVRAKQREYQKAHRAQINAKARERYATKRMDQTKTPHDRPHHPLAKDVQRPTVEPVSVSRDLARTIREIAMV